MITICCKWKKRIVLDRRNYFSERKEFLVPMEGSIVSNRTKYRFKSTELLFVVKAIFESDRRTVTKNSMVQSNTLLLLNTA